MDKNKLAKYFSLAVIGFGILAVVATGGGSTSEKATQQSAVETQVEGVSDIQETNISGEEIIAPATSTPTLAPSATPTPTYIPTNTPRPTVATIQSAPQSGLSNDDYYTNVDGNQVHSPAYSDTVPAGASAQCEDGTYSFSQNRRGTCSGHGGVSTWL